MSSEIKQSEPLAAIPRHVAIVMDGNGRWAKKRNMPRLYGHRKGVEAVRTTIEAAAKVGIKNLSFFAFSSENWKRPQEEVEGLMKLFLSSLKLEIPKLKKNNIRVKFIGDLERFSQQLQESIKSSEEMTRNCSLLTVNFCVNYGGRWDIIQAVQKLVGQNLDEEAFDKAMALAESGNVDLFIRTSGEQRISNFMLWQIAYSELYFTPVLWPDFGEKDFIDALNWYATRERRFGKTSEQLESAKS